MRQELAFFFASIATGIVMIWAYDLLRIFRRAIRHSRAAVSLEDLLYWLAASFLIFGMIFEKNNGALRGYAFAGILAGVWLETSVEHFCRRISIKLLKKVRKRGRMSDSRR